jgi:hypothetical protein
MCVRSENKLAAASHHCTDFARICSRFGVKKRRLTHIGAEYGNQKALHLQGLHGAAGQD